jgi:hypothetical protein
MYLREISFGSFTAAVGVDPALTSKGLEEMEMVSTGPSMRSQLEDAMKARPNVLGDKAPTFWVLILGVNKSYS